MKNVIKAFGFITLVAIIGFSFAACGGGDDGGDGDPDLSGTMTWTIVADSTFYIQSIAYGNGKFVIGGEDNGKMAFSSDGISWTAITDSKHNYGIPAIGYGNGKFVTASNSKVVYSSDGITWTAKDESTVPIIYAIAYGNGKFVVSTFNSTAYSSDGLTWTFISYNSLGGTKRIKSIAYGNGTFVAVGENGAIAYSSGN